MEFVPKTLADLHVESGLPTSDHMNGGNFSLHGKTHFTNTPLHHATTFEWSGCLTVSCSLFSFLSCRAEEGGRRLRIPTYYIDRYIAFSCLSLLSRVQNIWRDASNIRLLFYLVSPARANSITPLSKLKRGTSNFIIPPPRLSNYFFTL